MKLRMQIYFLWFSVWPPEKLSGSFLIIVYYCTKFNEILKGNSKSDSNTLSDCTENNMGNDCLSCWKVFQSDGTFVGKFGSCGSGRGQLEHPHYIAVSSTNRVIVSDGNNHRVQIFDVNGRVLTSFGSEGSDEGQFKFPRGVAVDDQGYIIVADSGNNRIQIFTPEGTFLKAFGGWGSGDGEFKGLEGVAVTSAGNIVVCDRENHRVQVF